MTVSLTSFITAADAALLLIDYQPQMLMGLRSDDPISVLNNAQILAKAAKLFGMPTVLTTITAESFAGPFAPEIARDVLPDIPIVDRTSINAWLDRGFVEAVAATGRRRLIIAGLWTGACATFNVLEAIARGHQAYFVSDACGDTSPQVHNRAVDRMMQAGAVPLTAQHFVYELQQDWARTETYQGVVDLLRPHSTFGQVQIPYGKWAIGNRAEGTSQSRQ
ncbi:isochorismatase family protein [Pararoseomonas sp. SCSIO 73927]|uniref:isochorismatase family protein n=1 Tax=Pararoseomonas sp. SCSIO 73927 TaxID=3114537 RepID=UPI0030D29060